LHYNRVVDNAHKVVNCHQDGIGVRSFAALTGSVVAGLGNPIILEVSTERHVSLACGNLKTPAVRRRVVAPPRTLRS
jgi:hypothetical protein